MERRSVARFMLGGGVKGGGEAWCRESSVSTQCWASFRFTLSRLKSQTLACLLRYVYLQGEFLYFSPADRLSWKPWHGCNAIFWSTTTNSEVTPIKSACFCYWQAEFVDPSADKMMQTTPQRQTFLSNNDENKDKSLSEISEGELRRLSSHLHCQNQLNIQPRLWK